MEFWQQVLAQLGGTAILIGLIGKWLLARAERELDRRLEERQNRRLEALKHEHQREIQALQAVEARLTSQFGVVASLGTATHAASLKVRLDAVEAIWRSVLDLRKRFPAVVQRLDLGTEEEYPRMREGNAWLQSTSVDDVLLPFLADPSGGPVELNRPMISEVLWQYFHAYRAFLGRVIYLTLDEKKKAVPWYKDTVICNMIKAVLTDVEYKQVMEAKIMRLGTARATIEGHILTEIRRELSGEDASKQAVTRVQAIEDAIRQASMKQAAS